MQKHNGKMRIAILRYWYDKWNYYRYNCRTEFPEMKKDLASSQFLIHISHILGMSRTLPIQQEKEKMNKKLMFQNALATER